MENQEKANAQEHTDAVLIKSAFHREEAHARGFFTVECRNNKGELKWRDTIENVVTTVGKNYALDGYLQTAVTIVGPYLGLISSVGYSATAAGDTMTSHAGWTEAGITNAPTYSGGRKTAAWSAAAAGSKSLSAALAFTFTGAGTIKGCFLVLSTGAVATVDNTSGTLYSAGVFTGGDKVVANTDVVNVSYTASL